jgi:prevent-host-death family protein
MCYMSVRAANRRRRSRLAGRVGVRELRQNLSVYLARVTAGETLQVTDRGRAVAVLAPLPAAATVVQQLVASGRAIAATRGLEDLPPLPPGTPRDLGRRVQAALEESRRDAG